MSLSADISAPIIATWDGTIADDGVFTLAVDAAGTLSVSANGAPVTLGTLDGTTAAGRVIDLLVVVKTSSAAGTVARARFVRSDTWDPAGEDAADAAGTMLVYRGGTTTEPRRGAGLGAAALTVAGFASDAPDAARAAVDVYVKLGLRGTGR